MRVDLKRKPAGKILPSPFSPERVKRNPDGYARYLDDTISYMDKHNEQLQESGENQLHNRMEQGFKTDPVIQRKLFGIIRSTAMRPSVPFPVYQRNVEGIFGQSGHRCAACPHEE